MKNEFALSDDCCYLYKIFANTNLIPAFTQEEKLASLFFLKSSANCIPKHETIV